jgi:DNA-binding response OmpR family regulator
MPGKGGTKARILIIEDEEGLVLSLTDRLESEGYEVDAIGDGLGGERKALGGDKYDLVLLDVMLPGKDGFQICKSIRDSGSRVPVLMLTARDTGIDTVMGLRLGADDYLAKPFDMQVLLARIDALLRRSGYSPKQTHREIVSFGAFVLDTVKQELYKGKKRVQLNAQEYKLLKFFVTNPETVLSREQLLDAVWGYDSALTTRTVDVHVAWLRQKLEEPDIPERIITVRGYGYKFVMSGQQSAPS